MAIDLILGTAGHIDHGKTALVKALTGTDTDRLPEEQRRGITIELGFAELDVGEFRFGIVDVPGHERFVRNMLAGATGIDVAMLVIAADDSVKPQTREHFEVLRLLGLPAGVIALSKCDLADPAWIELVEEEIRELVADSFLAEAPIIRTSAQTGAGLEALRAALADAGQKAAQSDRRKRVSGPFRMAIDRTFTIAGHGTVVTGSVSGGRVAVGDELVIEPGAIDVRVRGLQNHDRPAEEVHRGQRAALNLAGIHHDEIRRGQELATAGHLVPSRRISVSLRVLRSASRPLKHRTRVRCHLGTFEVMASISLVEQDQLAPGERGLAQLFLSEPVVSTWEQGFIIRRESPMMTLGGGQVLDPNARRLSRGDALSVARLHELESDDSLARASAATYFRGTQLWQPGDLSRLAGVDEPDDAVATLVAHGDLLKLNISPQRTQFLHRDVLAYLEQRVERALEKLHDRAPLRLNHPRSQIVRRLRHECDAGLLDAVLESMRASARITLTDKTIALADRGARLSEHQQRLLEQIISIFAEAGFQPPTVEEVTAQITKNQALVPQLVALAADSGELIKVSSDFYLHADAELRLRDTLAARMVDGDGLTISQIREILSTSRKYAVPFCEYLDRIGFTRREGDVRVLTRSSARPTA